MAPLRVGVLGPVTVWREGRELAAGQPRQLAVLGVLASRANRVVSRGELVDAVWGEETPASAEGGIYTYVAGLRRVLEPDGAPGARTVAARPGWCSSPRAAATCCGSAPARLDASDFEECLSRARGLRAAGDTARRGVRGGRGARAVARPAVHRGARAVRRGGAAAAHRAAHHRGGGAGRPDARPGAGRGGGARADRARGGASAARAGTRAADDRPVPVRAPGRGAAASSATPGNGSPRISASTQAPS